MAVRLLLLFLLLPVGFARAQPSPEVGAVAFATEMVYYEVTGATVAELEASLRARSPSTGGERFYGVTEWEVNAEYRWTERATGCSVEDIEVRLIVQTHLPRWSPRVRVDPDLRRSWSAFMRHLEAHEAQHRALITATGEALRWQLVSLRTPTCETMETEANRAVAAVIREGQARNEAYDRATRHGVTEGAVWPPLPQGTR